MRRADSNRAFSQFGSKRRHEHTGFNFQSLDTVCARSQTERLPNDKDLRATSGTGLLLAVALLGARVAWAANGRVNFHLMLLCVASAILLLLYQMQRGNNQIAQGNSTS
jgi:hypothetical protein